MEGEGKRITFEEADRRYAELRRQRDAGSLSEEEFGARLMDLMVQDDVEGRWWAKSPKSGDWYYRDGEKWIKDTPYKPTKEEPTQGVRRIPAEPARSEPEYPRQHARKGVPARAAWVGVSITCLLLSFLDISWIVSEAPLPWDSPAISTIRLLIVPAILFGALGVLSGFLAIRSGGRVSGGVIAALSGVSFLFALVTFFAAH